jgi:hypothetical protein
VVGPDGSRIHSFHPGGECTRVRAARKDPWNVLGVTVRVASERQADLVGEVCQVVDGILQGEVFEVLGCEVRERRGSAPVAVLQDDSGGSDLLGDDSGGAVGAEIASVAGGVDLAGGEEDDWRAWKGLLVLASCRCCGEVALTWPLPEGSVVEVELLESAQILVVVVNVLLEGGIAHTPGVLPVSARQMAHGAPSVHLIAMASRNRHRADQHGQKDLPHDRGAASVCRRLIIPRRREKAVSQ